MPARLEHANLTVRDLDGIVRFLQTAFPEFRVRRDSSGPTGRRWMHVGTDDTYLALNEPAEEDDAAAGAPGGRLHHLAYEVDNVAALRERLLGRGFRESGRASAHPHRHRVYFHDPDGNEWEFVEYLTPDPAKRHDYELPDRYESI